VTASDHGTILGRVTTFAAVAEQALRLPETSTSPSYGGAPALRVGRKLLGRLRYEMADDVDPTTGERYGEVLMVGVASLEEKEELLAADPRTYFTVPHYDGYPAVLVRLAVADLDEVGELVLDAWLRTATKRARKAYEETVRR
jgi:hypothetical protein